MRTSLWFWIGFHALVLGMLALDLAVFHRRARVVSAREAALWTAAWVVLALVFAGGSPRYEGTPQMLTFLTGYVIEESLSIDNIFVSSWFSGISGFPPNTSTGCCSGASSARS